MIYHGKCFAMVYFLWGNSCYKFCSILTFTSGFLEILKQLLYDIKKAGGHVHWDGSISFVWWVLWEWLYCCPFRWLKTYSQCIILSTISQTAYILEGDRFNYGKTLKYLFWLDGKS